MTSNTINVDNIIIGAGLSGLYCAWQLQQKNQDFIVLEAAAQTGGRIRAASKDNSIDTGATWFWPHQKNMLKLIADLKLSHFQQHVAGNTLFQHPNQENKVEVIQYQQGISYRIKDGSSQIIRTLTEQATKDKLRLNSAVTKIAKVANNTKQFNEWQITSWDPAATPKKAVIYQSENIFIAVPPRMLSTHFSAHDWLSQEAIAHLQQQQTWMSAQAKYVAVYDKAWWRGNGHSGFAISHRGPLAEIHDASENNKHSALFGFIGIPAQQRAKIDKNQLNEACRKQVSEIFNMPAPQQDFIQDWSTEEFVTSNLDIAESPKHGHVSLSLLGKDKDLTGIHFIGSEFSQTEPGYMEGAIDAVNVALSKTFP